MIMKSVKSMSCQHLIAESIKSRLGQDQYIAWKGLGNQPGNTNTDVGHCREATAKPES